MLDQERPCLALVLNGGIVRLDGRRTVVIRMPIEALQIWKLAQSGRLRDCVWSRDVQEA